MAPKYTDEALLQMIIDKADELGRTPYTRDIPIWSTMVNHFGSWNRAIIKAGLTPTLVGRKKQSEELLKLITRKAEELGKVPTSSDVPNVRTIISRFGTWNKALIAAGLTPNQIKRRKNNDNKETK